MCRKLGFLISFMVVLALAGQAAGQAAVGWDGGEPDSNNWLDPCNWTGDAVPGPLDTAEIVDGSITKADNFGEANMPVIYPGDNVQIGMLVVSTNNAFMPPGFEDRAFPAYLTVRGNLAVLGESIFIGSWWACHTGVLNIEPGATITDVGNPGRTWIGYRCRGEVYMTGGTWTMNQFEIARGDDCYTEQTPLEQPGTGTVMLQGGTITVNEFFTMRMMYLGCGDPELTTEWPDANGNLSVSGDGTLIINGDATAQLQHYVNEGWITAYGEPCDPNNPFDANLWYRPGTDPNDFWMPKRASLLIDYDIRNAGKTTLTAVLPARGEARKFNPPYGALGVGLTPVLSWSPGDYVAYGGEYLGTPNANKGNGHHVFFHTDKSWVDGANLNYPTGTAYGHIVGAQDANSLDIAPYMPGGKLKLDTTYYWRIIEVNDANATANPWFWKSTVSSFRTVGGGPANPNPGDGATLDYYLGDSLETDLNWSRGYYAADVNGHDVYFGTDFDEVNDASLSYDPAGTYQGRQTAQTSHVSNLLLGHTYYWRVDEVNLAGPDPCLWKGPVWSFSVAPYRIVEDFSSYADTAALQAAWQTNLYNPPCSLNGDGGTVELDKASMRFIYDNNDTWYGFDWFSEARYTYATPADFTQGDVSQDTKALQISLKGLPNNNDDPNYDRIYIAVEDNSGNIAVVYHDDPTVQTNVDMQQWDIDFRDFNGVDMSAVKKLYVGSGIRCNDNYNGTGGDGIVWFDDLRVYIPRCLGTPGYRQLGDLNGDCVVNIQDMKSMSNDWLAADELATASDPGTDGLVVRYTFDSAAGSTITDSSSNGYNGTAMYKYSDPNFVDPNLRDCDPCNPGDPNRVCCPNCPNYDPTNPYCSPGAPNEPNVYEVPVNAAYDPCGALGGCIDFTGVFNGPNEVNYGVEIPNDVFSQIGNQITISLWINAPENYAMKLLWDNLLNTDSGINVYCPTPGPPTFPFPDSVHWTVGTPTTGTYDTTLDWGEPDSSYFIGWHHFVFVHDADANFAAIYYNGDKVDDASRKEDFNYAPIKDANDFWLCATSTGSGGWWKGKIDDFRIYNRVLTHGEIVYLAGYPSKYYPLASLANIYGNDQDGKEPKGQRSVNFRDMATLAKDWMKADMWPLGTSP